MLQVASLSINLTYTLYELHLWTVGIVINTNQVKRYISRSIKLVQKSHYSDIGCNDTSCVFFRKDF